MAQGLTAKKSTLISLALGLQFRQTQYNLVMLGLRPTNNASFSAYTDTYLQSTLQFTTPFPVKGKLKNALFLPANFRFGVHYSRSLNLAQWQSAPMANAPKLALGFMAFTTGFSWTL